MSRRPCEVIGTSYPVEVTRRPLMSEMNSPDDQHTQPGILMRLFLGVIVVVFAMIWAGLILTDVLTDEMMVLGVMRSIVVGVLVLIHSLTVRVTQNEIMLSFGIGLVRKRIMVDEIESAQAVQNHWYSGWGIKKIWGGWMYHVSGFDAVELRMRHGRVNRIGTDEPQTLLAAIAAVIASSAGAVT